jgi:hypothetical protein
MNSTDKCSIEIYVGPPVRKKFRTNGGLGAGQPSAFSRIEVADRVCVVRLIIYDGS